jgi:hypothetical protein
MHPIRAPPMTELGLPGAASAADEDPPLSKLPGTQAQAARAAALPRNARLVFNESVRFALFITGFQLAVTRPYALNTARMIVVFRFPCFVKAMRSPRQGRWPSVTSLSPPANSTVIQAQFPAVTPNGKDAEIKVRQAVFTPEKSGIVIGRRRGNLAVPEGS